MTLAPTLWRTCRALANPTRLRLLHYLLHRPATGVSDIAEALNLRVPVASQYLRALNARGLLRVKRRGRRVLYEAGADSTMMEPALLLKALRPSLETEEDRKKALDLLTGFTHPRRIELLRAMARGATDLPSLRSTTRISIQAMMRHLRKLKKRGYVISGRGTYHCVCPKHPLAEGLLALSLR